jgi:hypothetical protein
MIHEVPIGASPFIPYEEGIQSDHYLWLAGKASEMLRAEIPFSTSMPERVSSIIRAGAAIVDNGSP